MARPVLGKEFLEQALEQRKQTADVRELRILQAVILPLQGHTIAQAAERMGKSPGWVSEARRQDIKNNGSICPACKGFAIMPCKHLPQRRPFWPHF